MNMKRILGMILTLAMVFTLFSVPAAAAETEEGSAAGHVIINQVYGASDDGYASHSFIELYNPTEQTVDLNGWSVQYRSSEDGDQSGSWAVCGLTGKIAAKGYYLIRCGAVTKPSGSYQVPDGNQEWNVVLHNKGLAVALLTDTTPLTDAFAGDITAEGAAKPESFVDLAAVQGNDGTVDQAPPVYEGAYSAIQSKKKAIRRNDFADTDNNAADFTEVNYSKSVSEANGPHKGDAAGTEPTPPVPSYTPAETGTQKYEGFFNETAAVKAEMFARYNAGAYSADGGSAEITAYNPVNRFAYSVNGVKGTLDCINMTNLQSGTEVQNLTGTELKAAELAESVSNFTYGDMTSAAVSPDGTLLAVSMQAENYTESGRVLVFSCQADGSLVYQGSAITGVQPDMVTFSEEGQWILTADEGEPREGYSAASAVDPKGSVTMIPTQAFQKEKTAGPVVLDETAVSILDFSQFDTDTERSALVEKGIVLKKGALPSVDLEPEYITVCGGKAYIALQEANAIAVLDLAAKTYDGIFSVGFEDYSKIPVDINKSDEKYEAKTYAGLKGIRIPDGIASYQIGGETYLLTANEGDSRAWPVGIETDVNEVKDKTSPVNEIKPGAKVTWFDVSQYDGLEAGTDYLFGGRSFTILKVTENGLEEVYDSGCDFEAITAEKLPQYFNCSNDTVEIEDRSGKKGPEPENVTVGQIDGKTYAFIGLERVGGVMVYDITTPQNAKFVNYLNSRDFSADIRDDVSPEGLCFIAADQNAARTSLVLASNEVSGTVSVNAFTPVRQPENGGSGSGGYVPVSPTKPDDQKPDADKTDDDQQKAAKLLSGIKFTARSSRTEKGNVKVVLQFDNDGKKAIAQIQELGYTVKYRFYRSTKSSRAFRPTIAKTTRTYCNTSGTNGTKYYYKARVCVYDAEGKLLAASKLTQCRYACRIWKK